MTRWEVWSGWGLWYNIAMSKNPIGGESAKCCHSEKLSFVFSHYCLLGGGPHLEWNGKKSLLRWRDAFGDVWFHLPTPSEIQWKAFWLLVEQSGVRTWEGHYTNPDIVDGQGWDFKMKGPGLRIETRGINAYPGSDSLEPNAGSPFDILTAAIGILVGCAPHDLKASPHSRIYPGIPPDVEVDSGDGEEGELT